MSFNWGPPNPQTTPNVDWGQNRSQSEIRQIDQRKVDSIFYRSKILSSEFRPPTLGQITDTDNNNQITSFLCSNLLYCTVMLNGTYEILSQNMQLITLTVITLSGFHCLNGHFKQIILMKQARAVSEEAKRRENINVRAAFIHVIGDFIQSLGVFIAALIIYFYPHLVISFIKLLCNWIFSRKTVAVQQTNITYRLKNCSQCLRLSRLVALLLLWLWKLLF